MKIASRDLAMNFKIQLLLLIPCTATLINFFS